VHQKKIPGNIEKSRRDDAERRLGKLSVATATVGQLAELKRNPNPNPNLKPVI